MGTSFLDSCLHGLPKVNSYNHVFLNYLQVFELDLKFVVVLKSKVQVFESKLNIFASFFLKKTSKIDVMNILILFFWLMKFVFIAKKHP